MSQSYSVAGPTYRMLAVEVFGGRGVEGVPPVPPRGAGVLGEGLVGLGARNERGQPVAPTAVARHQLREQGQRQAPLTTTPTQKTSTTARRKQHSKQFRNEKKKKKNCKYF